MILVRPRLPGACIATQWKHYQMLMLASLAILRRYACRFGSRLGVQPRQRSSVAQHNRRAVTLRPPLAMLKHDTDVLLRDKNEVEQILDRMRRNCEAALEVIQDADPDDLSPESREQLYGQTHTLREIVRLLSPDFEQKVIVKTAKLGRALSRDEVLDLLYGLDDL